jgi:hypothetical protein
MANNNYYLGVDPVSSIGDAPRYFYGLRKNSNGSLFLQRVDQAKQNVSIEVNYPGEPEGNYTDFEVGVDFFEGINIYHNQVFDNLKYPQYRWDDRSILYYVDDDGQLVARINNSHEYDNLDSEE